MATPCAAPFLAYVVTLLPSVAWTPLKVTRIGTEHRDLAPAGNTMLDGAQAILRDFTQRDWSAADAAAFAAMVFKPSDRGSVAQTIKGEQVARFVDAIGRERAVA